MEKVYQNIPKEKFVFAQLGEKMHDEKLQTKSRGYFADAFLRFRKNKSSVIAACIIALLVLFAIVSPIVSIYDINDKEPLYKNYAPFIEGIAEWNLGIWDGGTVYTSVNENQMLRFEAIQIETGRNPVLKVMGTETVLEPGRGMGNFIEKNYYTLRVNKYYEKGIVIRTMSVEEFQKIQEFQNETGVQVIYPWVNAPTGKAFNDYKVTDNPNVWYEISDAKGTPKLKDGQLVPAYSTDTSIEKTGAEYNSQRISSDPGTYAYSKKTSGAVQCRVDLYNYYEYSNGYPPTYIFGTNALGQDVFTAIGVGARFSLAFAVIVSAINLTIGAIYGAIQGYYGGYVDLIMDRISDILSGVPSIVTVTLFQLHFAQKVGPIVSFLFAFVLTGWIGMAALTRKQFYRFKGQEYIMAAKTLGASDWRLMFKHIFPNSLGTIVTSCVLVIPGVISSETTLTYLGIVNLSQFSGTSIGVLMQQGQTAMTTSPHAMFFPALFISLLLISFNLFGNGLRDAFNPSMRGVED